MAYISSWGNDHEKPKYNLKRGEFSGSKSVAQSRVSHPNQTWQPLKVGHFQPFFRPKIHQNGRIFLNEFFNSKSYFEDQDKKLAI